MRYLKDWYCSTEALHGGRCSVVNGSELALTVALTGVTSRLLAVLVATSVCVVCICSRLFLELIFPFRLPKMQIQPFPVSCNLNSKKLDFGD